MQIFVQDLVSVTGVIIANFYLFIFLWEFLAAFERIAILFFQANDSFLQMCRLLHSLGIPGCTARLGWST